MFVPASDPSQAARGNVLVRGVPGTTAVGDDLLLMSKAWDGGARNYALVKVTGVALENDTSGRANMLVSYSFHFRGSDFPARPQPLDFRLQKSSQSSHLYQYVSANVIPQGQDTIDLESITRGISVGDEVLFEDPSPTDSNSPQLVRITSYSEVIYYANNPSNPTQPPSNGSEPFSGAAATPAIPIPHTQLKFTPKLDLAWDVTVTQVVYGWKDVGEIIQKSATTFGGAEAGALGPRIDGLAIADRALPLDEGTDVLVQDAFGKGVAGSFRGNAVHLQDLQQALAPPIQALFNVFAVSCGKTVAGEILGSGNSLVAGQDFVLQKSPVTYLQDPRSVSGDDYSSTVRVWVNQLEWSEVKSFYGQMSDDRVFATREDEQSKTHVVFGDGTNGSRLPTGMNNVVASYRYGGGADTPPAGSLTVVTQLQPGLRSVLNPVPVGGGADPDPLVRVRRLAPRSLLTLGRAVSIDDFEALALQTPGVRRAMAALVINQATQRSSVTVWVGDDQSAVTAAQAAFRGAADPNRQPQVMLAGKVIISLGLTVVYDPRHFPEVVQDAVRTALVDADTGLFGLNVVTIGQVFYDSQIYAACLAIPGVVSVHSLNLAVVTPPPGSSPSRVMARSSTVRLAPGAAPREAPGGQKHDPGAGSFFALADDTAQPSIIMELAT
jgi:hypothetical protein